MTKHENENTENTVNEPPAVVGLLEITRVMNKYTPLKTWAKTNGHDSKHARRLARAGKLESAFQFDNRWYMPTGATDVVPPPQPRGGGTTRTDGRERYIVFASPITGELNAVREIVGASNVINPRVVAKNRRADKKRAAIETAAHADSERERLAAIETAAYDTNDTAQLNAARERLAATETTETAITDGND